ncbi:MAG: hypothetical protein H7A00_07460 [Hahellaceae bacterium]|nr:hypothetical protein [Hahellaceae bacterium]
MGSQYNIAGAITHLKNRRLSQHPLLKTILPIVLISLCSNVWGADANFDFFSDQPIEEAALVHVEPPKPAWMTIGGPIALLSFFFLFCGLIRWLIPFRQTALSFTLHDLPVAAQRGIGIAVVLYGIAFCFGGVEINYQMSLHGSAEVYFQNMGLGKLIAFTHAHLFGFTTSFFVVGIPFSLHFNRLKIYQWMFPLGLAASLTDVISWWGIKFVSGNFEYVTWWCGTVFSISYVWMLIGLVRVLFFPKVKWLPDFINEKQQKRWNEKHSDD